MLLLVMIYLSHVEAPQGNLLILQLHPGSGSLNICQIHHELILFRILSSLFFSGGGVEMLSSIMTAIHQTA